MRTLQTVCAWATFKLQLAFWAVPVHVLGLLFSPLNASIPAWLWFQLCRFCFPCPPDSKGVNSPVLWSMLNSSVLVSVGDTGCGWLSAAAQQCHTEHAGFLLLYSQSVPRVLVVVFTCAVHPVPTKKAGRSAWGWGLDFSLLIVPQCSVHDKTSSLKGIQLHLFLYLFKTLLSFISRGSSTFFHFTDSTVLVWLQINLSNTCSPKMRGKN